MRRIRTPTAAARTGVALVAVLLCALPAANASAAKEPKKRVAVTAFENRAGNYDKREFGDLGKAMAEKLVEVLIESDKFVVLERLALRDVLGEQELDGVVPLSPQVRSRLTSAQALIRGVVTNVETSKGAKGGLSWAGVRVGGGGSVVIVTVNVRLIDVITGQVLQSKTVTGKAKKRGGLLQVRHGGVDLNLEGEQGLPVGQAVEQAMRAAVAGIVDGLESVPWQGSLVRVSGRRVFVNAGLRETVQPGLRLRVFEKGPPLIDPETNVDLGSLDEEIGVIEIQQVSPRFSVARVLEGRGFAPGNLVRPVD
ncbi:MAG TPA: CsgG/HfaB family protein [Thermoanaerobaculia bacterium]|nr:CsgG/HfaB family protein [Thermoanaerobaculia bacterium]